MCVVLLVETIISTNKTTTRIGVLFVRKFHNTIYKTRKIKAAPVTLLRSLVLPEIVLGLAMLVLVLHFCKKKTDPARFEQEQKYEINLQSKIKAADTTFKFSHFADCFMKLSQDGEQINNGMD